MKEEVRKDLTHPGPNVVTTDMHPIHEQGLLRYRRREKKRIEFLTDTSKNVHIARRAHLGSLGLIKFT